MKTYEDKYLRNRVSTIIQQQKLGKILVDAYKSGSGLPTKEELGAILTRAPYPHDYQVGLYGFLDFDRGSEMYVFTSRPGAELPAVLKNYQPLSLVEAKIDSANKTIHIQNGEMVITFTSAPVWTAGYSLMREINDELARQSAGVVVWKLTWENENISNALFPRQIPQLRNSHASVTLTGYAVDPDTHCLVYGGCVGYKTSLESIRATLITGKPLSLNEQMAQPVDRYEVVWQAMPEYTSHHACFMNRLALSSKWEPEDEVAYLLVFQDSITGITESTHLFVERLMEILEVPVLEEWAEALWKAALQYRFISEIETAGDCVFGVKLDLKADWKGLIEKLLQEGELQLA